jgi:hypothetical protein
VIEQEPTTVMKSGLICDSNDVIRGEYDIFFNTATSFNHFVHCH